MANSTGKDDHFTLKKRTKNFGRNKVNVKNMESNSTIQPLYISSILYKFV